MKLNRKSRKLCPYLLQIYSSIKANAFFRSQLLLAGWQSIHDLVAKSEESGNVENLQHQMN